MATAVIVAGVLFVAWHLSDQFGKGKGMFALLVLLGLGVQAEAQTIVRPEGYIPGTGTYWSKVLELNGHQSTVKSATMGVSATVFTNGAGTQLVALPPDGVEYTSEDWDGGTTIIGEAKATRLELEKANQHLENITAILGYGVGLFAAWSLLNRIRFK